MKLSSLITASLVLFSALTASATVTISFNGSFSNGVLSNLANGSGAVTNGMKWGIVISTTDAVFAGSGTAYDAYTAGSSTAGFLSYAGSTTDDYFVPGTTTLDTSGLQEGDFSTTGGNGGIADDIASLALANGISAGDKFALVWFGSPGSASTAGSKYGFFTDASFLVPADGNTVDYSTPFVGADPIRPANNTFVGAGPIPEPSRALLLGFGAVGLMFRRRRA